MAKSTTAPKKGAKQKPSAQLIDGDKTQNLPIEEVPNNLPVPAKVQPPAEMTAEEKATQEVQRFNLPRAWIAEKKAAYTGLTIAGIEDKDGFKTVKEAWQEIRNKRLDVDKQHKNIKGDYLKITQAIDKEKRDLTELLEEIETPLKAELDRIENLKEEEKKKAEREKAEKLQGRVNELLNNGMVFNGSYYAIGAAISMDVVTLQNMNDADYTTFLGRVQSENAAIIEAKEEKEKKEREEREALEAQKKEQEETQRKLDEQKRQQDEQQAAIERQKKEALDARTKARGYMLEAMGMFYNFGTHVWEFKTLDAGNFIIHRAKVETLEGEDWETELTSINEAVKKLKTDQQTKDNEKAQAEKERKEREEKERKEAEEKRIRIVTRKAEISAHFGMKEQPDGSFKRLFSYTDIAPLVITKSQIENFDQEAWAVEIAGMTLELENGLKMQDVIKKRKDLEAEAARQAALSDRDRLNEWLREFGAAMGRKPVIEDSKLVQAFAAFDRAVIGAVEDLTLILDNIK
jgi:hypothetical protein